VHACATLTREKHRIVRRVNSLFFITIPNQRPYSTLHFRNDRRQPARYRESGNKERRDEQPKIIKSRQLSTSLLESDFGIPIKLAKKCEKLEKNSFVRARTFFKVLFLKKPVVDVRAGSDRQTGARESGAGWMGA